ncbi:succinate dehydrogenase, cytochrome b556 subunit [Noviherbaspirillum galbum]|uniref:Succinate dehydrogenase cytochrome b556 subunit n=1 Tax=Noviherbaspirillum galbum TaxID=2709383 RepID=A0A6B3SPB1_9BURK|nr:succinate dehydrogenase, cytochrome b556 subunit [Noviherbaspirillum galbum]NEX62497.1 succinate dehydrogenase, cytochrome b556 subunit [Noviherbaspirillum galbum]NEX62587.1 succinate dehydrogenase, cytochrome b556 subunit [Noviherbaspirillum galbum]
MSEAVKKPRRQFNVMTFSQVGNYRLPLPAYVSILHRVSGAAMFFLLPFTLYLLDKSLTSEISFDALRGFTANWFVKLVILGLVWSYLHHFCAGVRHLFLDMHMGMDKVSGKQTSAAVFAVSLPLTLLVALKLFGVF